MSMARKQSVDMKAYLSEFAHLLAQTANTCKRSPSRVLETHLVHHGVDFSGQDAHDGERGHVEADAGACFELRGGEGGAVGDDVSGAGGCFDDDCISCELLC